MITFKASYIQSLTIKEKINNKYVDKSVSMIELDPQNKQDLFALKEVSSNWLDGETFANEIYRDANLDSWTPTQVKKYFAITEQENLSKTLNENKILALAEILNKSEKLTEIVLLQVNPLFNFHSISSKYKKIGSAFLDTLKTMFPKHDLILQSALDAKKFYLKNGFEFMENSSLKMMFKR